MKTSKFNKSEILKKAWALVKWGWSLSEAMKAAWQYARNVIADAGKVVYKGDNERIFSSPTQRLKRPGLDALQAAINRGLAK